MCEKKKLNEQTSERQSSTAALELVLGQGPDDSGHGGSLCRMASEHEPLADNPGVASLDRD